MSDTPLTDSLLDHRADLRGPYADPRARWDFDDALAFIAWARLLERDRARLKEALQRIMKATPHSMCADAAAWSLGEAALASLEE